MLLLPPCNQDVWSLILLPLAKAHRTGLWSESPQYAGTTLPSCHGRCFKHPALTTLPKCCFRSSVHACVWPPARPRSPRLDPSHPSLAARLADAFKGVQRGEFMDAERHARLCTTILGALGCRFGTSGSGINGSGTLSTRLLFENPRMGWVQLDPINLATEWASCMSLGLGCLGSL